MAYPIHPSEGYVRTPGKYVHDAFGADTGGRVRPHTGIDSTPTVANARNRAVLAGVVTRAGFSVYTGNYVEIRDAQGRYWLTFHQRQNLVKPGAIVAEGSVIGYTGNTGGSGAIGSAKIGVHNHTSLCATQSAATRLITGQVRARYKNETVAQWAAERGLLDPWLIIRDGDKTDAPATGGDQEDDMFSDEDRRLLQAIRDDQKQREDGVERSRSELTLRSVRQAESLARAIRDGDVTAGGWTYQQQMLPLLQSIAAAVGKSATAAPADVDIKGLAASIREGLGDELANELAKRLAS